MTAITYSGALPRSSKRRARPLAYALLAIGALMAVPVLVVGSAWLRVDVSIWRHILDHLLLELLGNTVLLALGVAIGTGWLGVSLGWLVAAYDFPGRRHLTWALMLPLAVPAYVTAFVAVGLLDYSGPLQTLLRGWFGADLQLPNIRSLPGLTVVMSLCLYPYVYMLARNAFEGQGRRLLETAMTLGASRRQAFFRAALPMARPWIAAGLTLALMETLADFGAVSVFNIDTFTTAIYKSWFSLFSIDTAAQLAGLLLLLVLLLIWLEHQARAGQRFAQDRAGKPAERMALRGRRAWIATAYCSSIVLLAFVVPLLQLMVWTGQVWREVFDERYPQFIAHSMLLAGITGLAVCVISVVLAYGQRRLATPRWRLLVRFSTLGYAMPGALLAVGLFLPVAWVDRLLIEVLQVADSPVLRGTLLVMLSALLVRFLAVGFNPVESAMQRISPRQEDAARLLGAAGWPLLRRVHLPQMRGGLLTAFLLVFVDVMKEMPITLMTRPFGWDTLAVRVFEMTSEGQWQQAAAPALVLVAVGLLPVVALARRTA